MLGKLKQSRKLEENQGILQNFIKKLILILIKFNMRTNIYLIIRNFEILPTIKRKQC